jgi:hypothetical protein
MQPPAYAGYARVPSAGNNNLAIALVLVGGLIVVTLIGVIGFVAVSGSGPHGTEEKGSLSVEPSTFSCSANATVTLTVRLPASLNGDDRVRTKLDGALWGDVKISNQFDQQSDGTWLESHPSILNTCQGPNGRMADGQHTLQVIDQLDHVVAEGTFTTTP